MGKILGRGWGKCGEILTFSSGCDSPRIPLQLLLFFDRISLTPSGWNREVCIFTRPSICQNAFCASIEAIFMAKELSRT